jgi:integrase
MSASLRRRGRYFHIDLHQFGRRIRRTLKIESREQAERVRAEFQHSMVGGLWNVPLSIDLPLSRIIERFQKEYEPLHHAASTQKHTRLTFARFESAMRRKYGSRGTLDSIRAGDIQDFQLQLLMLTSSRGQVLSHASVNRSIRELSVLFNWAIPSGVCRHNPCSSVRPLREVRRLVEPASLADLERLVDVVPPVIADLVRIILYTGLRLGEALHLQRTDVSFDTGTLYVRSRPEYLVKTRVERAISLTGPAASLCRRRILQAGASVLLFPSTSGGVIGNRNALRALHAGCASAGLRPLNWKLLRKTFTTLQAKTLNPWELKVVLGHRDIRTTDRHYMLLTAQECKLRSLSLGEEESR